MMLIHVNGRPYFVETKPQAVKFLKFWSEEIAMDEIRPVPCVRGIERCPSWVPNRLMLPGIEYSKK